jgi:hypothetical protein
MSIWKRHWVTFVPHVPFAVMLIVHRVRGFSWAMNGPTPLGEIPANGYNMAMMLVLWVSTGAYVTHAILLLDRGRNVAIAKVLVVVVIWLIMG